MSTAESEAVSSAADVPRGPSRRFRLIVSIALLCATGLLLIWLESAEPWSGELPTNPANYASHFFSAQAASMLDGHIDIPQSALPGECFIYQGNCYGYFGITPSLLRLPIVAVDPSRGMAGSFLVLALLIGIGASVLIVNEIWSQVERRRIAASGGPTWRASILFVAAIAAVCPGSILFQLTQPNVFQEAIAWCASFTLCGFWLVLRWFGTGRISYLWVAVLAMTLAASARPTGMVTSAALAVVLGLLIVRSARLRQVRARQLAPVLALAVVPAGLAMAVFWWKFEAVVPDVRLNIQIGGGNPGWTAMLEASGGRFFSPIFLPTMLWTYIRPDSLIMLHGHLWFARPVRVPPTPIGGYYIEPTASLTNLMPVALLLGALALVITPWWRAGVARLPTPRSGRLSAWLVRGLLLALISGTLPTVMNIAASNRYLGDFVPFTVAAVGFGASTILAFSARRPTLGRLLIAVVMALILVGIVTNLSLAYWQIDDRVVFARQFLPPSWQPSWPWGLY